MKKKATVQERVVKVLKGQRRGFTPTEIGLKLGYERRSASAMVGPALRKMLAAELVTRHCIGNRTEYVWV
jgi:hypothetical protein